MSSTLLVRCKREVEERGYCRIQGMPVSEVTSFAKQWGMIVPDPRTGADVRDLKPQPSELANPNTLSSRYGLGSFPFHTEAAYLSPPPNLLILYCQSSGPGRRPTYLIDSAPLIESLSCSGRKGSWIVKSGRKPALAYLVEQHARVAAFQYDADCMFPLSRTAQREQETVREFIKAAPRIELAWNDSDVAVISNARMLHGRGSSDVDDTNRVLKRILIRG